jgi:hypothetical protein
MAAHAPSAGRAPSRGATLPFSAAKISFPER